MKRVLVVDDEMPIRSAAMHILRRAGYQVEAAVDGFDALEQLRHTPADAVLLDMKMPMLDGFGFLQAYRANPGLAPVPVVLMSADDQLERRGLEMGGSRFVRKPLLAAAVFAHGMAEVGDHGSAVVGEHRGEVNGERVPS